jgi:hypothetical protein
MTGKDIRALELLYEAKRLNPKKLLEGMLTTDDQRRFYKLFSNAYRGRRSFLFIWEYLKDISKQEEDQFRVTLNSLASHVRDMFTLRSITDFRQLQQDLKDILVRYQHAAAEDPEFFTDLL